jgi:hypothetical protein
MGKLVNECRWSSSRESTFTECRKKYWYSYYGAWEGWPKTPYDTRVNIDPLAKYLYMLKNMQPAHTFVGTAVHKAIEWALQVARPTKNLPFMEEILQRAQGAFLQGIEDSKGQLWKKHPKHHVNLVEHYYGFPFAEQDHQMLLEKISRCIENWYESPCVKKGILDPRSEWLGIEDCHTFAIAPKLEAVVVFDLLFRWRRSDGSHALYVLDWKTGQESKKIEDQLSAYALAIHTVFHVPYEDVVALPFYLSISPNAYKKYGVGQEFDLSLDHLAEMQKKILNAARCMMELHPEKNPDGTVPLPEVQQFFYTEDRRICRTCPFQELCQAAQYRDVSAVELKQFVPKE